MLWSARSRPPAHGNEWFGVVVIDPVPIFREGLATCVLRDPGMRLMGSTGHLQQVLLMRDRLGADVLVIDSALDPRGQLARLFAEGAKTPSILVLVREPELARAVLAAGVHGVVRRGAPAEQVLEAIRRCHYDRRYIDPALAPVVGDRPARQQPAGVGGAGLSEREYQVLQLVADGLSNQSIADTLFISVETVRTHMKSILRKLGARDRAHAVAGGFRRGLLLPYGERPVPAGGWRLPRQRTETTPQPGQPVAGSGDAMPLAPPQHPAGTG